jgi:hypothetical protein
VKAQIRIGQRSQQKVLHALLPAAIILLVSVAGCNGTELNSQWRDREIKIDGLDTEWENTRVYLKDAGASVAVLNDREFVYISFVTAKQQTIRQVMAEGLTLWLDAEGGKDKTFGIRFPLGMAGSRMPRPSPNEGERDSEEMSETRAELFKRANLELEILGPGEDQQQRCRVATLEGIEAKASLSNNTLVYELKVPIAQSDTHPFAIRAEQGQSIGVGIETPEIDRDKMREGMGGGKRGGGMRGGGPGFERPQPLKVWAKVQLAAPVSSDSDPDDETVSE